MVVGLTRHAYHVSIDREVSMSKWILIIIAMVGVVGCAPGYKEPVIDSTFSPYLDLIQDQANTRGIYGNLTMVSSIEFGSTPKGLAGYCYRKVDTQGYTREITIDREAWDNGSELYRVFLLAHEIGHCALDKSHNETMMVFKGVTVPASLMVPGTIYAARFAQFDVDLQAHYWNQFFTK